MPNRKKYFTKQVVRDLEWVVFSPPLITKIQNSGINFAENLFSENEKSFFKELLTELEKNPSELIEFLERKNSHLLGKYFEALVEYSLIKSPDKKLIAANLQINSNKKTLGELDFIYRDLVDNKIIHLETAGKFFIAHYNKYNKIELLGPNPNDSFDKKIEKIKSSQISLASTKEGKSKLSKIGVKEKVFARVFFKGYVFYSDENADMPEFLNPRHLQGKIMRVNNLCGINGKSYKWKILERKEWVSPFATEDEEILNDWKTLSGKVKSYFKNNDYPLLISKIINVKRCFVETERYFILSENWLVDFNNGRV